MWVHAAQRVMDAHCTPPRTASMTSESWIQVVVVVVAVVVAAVAVIAVAVVVVPAVAVVAGRR